jgi:hypothetical protein
MNQAEWLGCTEPGPMLDALRGKASERKLRLFACACCRRLWNLLHNKYSRKALTVAERYADGEVSAEKLGFAWGDARRAARVTCREDRETAEAAAMWAVSLLCEADIGRAVTAVGPAAWCEAYPVEQRRFARTQREQVVLLQDIVGNPFGTLPTLAPSARTWNAGTTVQLATAIYEDCVVPAGTFRPDRVAVLADALEDAGCRDGAILAHLRSPGAHVRGCWAVDLLLGKS